MFWNLWTVLTPAFLGSFFVTTQDFFSEFYCNFFIMDYFWHDYSRLLQKFEKPPEIFLLSFWISIGIIMWQRVGGNVELPDSRGGFIMNLLLIRMSVFFKCENSWKYNSLHGRYPPSAWNLGLLAKILGFLGLSCISSLDYRTFWMILKFLPRFFPGFCGKSNKVN